MTHAEAMHLDCGRDYPVTVLPYGRSNGGVPVIMLHGLESHSAWFVRSAAHIAERGHPVYGMERRGSGRSTAPRGWCRDFRDLVADIDALADYVLKEHGAGSFHLVGHCFGAIPATAYACSQPARLKSLILATPALNTQATLPLPDRLKVLWSALSGSRLQVPVPLQPEWFTDLDEHLYFIRNDPLALHTASARIYWEVIRARRFIRSREQALGLPVFMALAGRDRICDNRANNDFLERIPAPEKRAVEYADAVHILEFSVERERFFADLDRWLAEHAA